MKMGLDGRRLCVQACNTAVLRPVEATTRSCILCRLSRDNDNASVPDGIFHFSARHTADDELKVSPSIQILCLTWRQFIFVGILSVANGLNALNRLGLILKGDRCALFGKISAYRFLLATVLAGIFWLAPAQKKTLKLMNSDSFHRQMFTTLWIIRRIGHRYKKLIPTTCINVSHVSLSHHAWCKAMTQSEGLDGEDEKDKGGILELGRKEGRN